MQLAEEKSHVELYRKREEEYLKEIDELKSKKRRFEDELIELQSKSEKFHRNDNEKVSDFLN